MSKKQQIISILIVVIIILLSSAFTYIKASKTNETTNLKDTSQIPTTTEETINQALETPEQVKGIYMTGYVFANNKLRNNLIKLVEETELNSIVIDLKDPAGKLMFEPKDELLKPWPLSKTALTYDDYYKILKELQAKNIYTIARITTFQDSTAAENFRSLALKNYGGGLWRDYRGVAWLDMTNNKSWDLVIAQAKEAIEISFDEIQFDYIRFPSDGNIKNIVYSNFPSG